jgi:peptide deformylase
MASLEIAKLGNPVLRKKAEPVSQDEIGTEAFQQFIDDMFETMVEAEGIGLAAPQVSRTQQVVVMDLPGEGGFPKTVLINPKIVFYGPQQVENWEGCLSVDGLRGKVTRPSMIRVQALDRYGAAVDFEATGLFGVCIQHELDHLIGKVFLDRMAEFSSLTQLEEFDRYWKQEDAAVI